MTDAIKLTKNVEGKRTNFIVPLGKNFDDRFAFMDVTDTMFDAIRVDRKAGYPGEQGPAFEIERVRAEEYTRYVAAYATRDNMHKFDTRAYRFFVGSVTETEVNKSRRV